MPPLPRLNFSIPSKGMETCLLDIENDHRREIKKRGAREDFMPFGIANKFSLKTRERFINLVSFTFRDSGRNLKTKMELKRQAAPAIKNGRVVLCSARMPPKAGPNIMPIAEKAPNLPNAFKRSCFVVMSAT